MSIDEYIINIREWKTLSCIESEPFYIAETIQTHTTIRVYPEEYRATNTYNSEGFEIYKKKENDPEAA